MIKLRFDDNGRSTYQVLCLGAHCDDLEIGCGGTILKLLEAYQNIHINWIVFSSNEQREKEALSSANYFLKKAKSKNIIIKKFRDSFFPFIGAEIKEFFEEQKQHLSPDIIFTHYKNDLHQDHRLISDLTWNTFRNHLILEYEIPKYDGDLGSPNVFVHLDGETCNKKAEYILNCFESQKTNSWCTKDTFFSLLRLRGIESNSPHNYAEAFYNRKLVLR